MVLITSPPDPAKILLATIGAQMLLGGLKDFFMA
jgi:hypothetical protein